MTKETDRVQRSLVVVVAIVVMVVISLLEPDFNFCIEISIECSDRVL